jgi:ribonuclease R
MGADSGRVIGLGQRVTVRLAEAVPVTGGLMLELLDIEGQAVAAGRSSRRGRNPMRKAGAAAAKARKIRKVERRRK